MLKVELGYIHPSFSPLSPLFQSFQFILPTPRPSFLSSFLSFLNFHRASKQNSKSTFSPVRNRNASIPSLFALKTGTATLNRSIDDKGGEWKEREKTFETTKKSGEWLSRKKRRPRRPAVDDFPMKVQGGEDDVGQDAPGPINCTRRSPIFLSVSYFLLLPFLVQCFRQESSFFVLLERKFRQWRRIPTISSVNSTTDLPASSNSR